MLLGWAVILPLVSFFVILVFGPRMGKAGEHAASLATAAIALASILSFASLAIWLYHHPISVGSHDEGHASPGSPDPDVAVSEAKLVFRGQNPDGVGHVAEPPVEGHDTAESGHSEEDEAHAQAGVPEHYKYHTGDFNAPGFGGPWVLGQFGDLRVSISYYIDALTVCMFCMVTFIATLIHIYATGYMHDELHAITDHEVTLKNGEHLHRPGRYPRFFQYLSLFCFSMLGLVIAGNIAMVFVFWELVGVCSYFLIGFYIERKSASNAANKAFIVNRVGDFGMILGLLALWTGLGTFSFGDVDLDANHQIDPIEKGIFTQVREAQDFVHGHGHGEIRVMGAPDGMVRLSAKDKIAATVRDHRSLYENDDEAIAASDTQADS
ncbi:MAG: proton-conducting transporter membrane subunit, partial [Planctomycetota bacterium]